MGFISTGGLLGKKDCWRCIGNTRVKKRVSKLVPCGVGWQSSPPNCGVRVVTNRPRPNTGGITSGIWTGGTRPTTVVNNRPRPNTGGITVDYSGIWTGGTRPVVGRPVVGRPLPYLETAPAENVPPVVVDPPSLPNDTPNTTTINHNYPPEKSEGVDTKTIMFIAVGVLAVLYLKKK